jgi:ATP-binding cassette subfamily B protein
MTDDILKWQQQALDAVVDIAGLSSRPSAIVRARARIMEITDTSAASLEVIASTLREIGIAAQCQRVTSSTPLPLTDTGVLTLNEDGWIIQTTISASTPWSALLGKRSELQVIVINGRYHSVFTGDTSMPDHRGHPLYDSKHHGLDKDAKELPYRFRDVWPSIKRMLRLERRDIWIVMIYSIVTSLLGLVVPLSSQSIVNAVALGVFSQQLIVLCIVVFLALTAMAFLDVLERHVIDMIQRRMFVSTAFDVVYRLPHLTNAVMRRSYGPELVNRFFDVITVQKSVAKFLLEGTNALLVVLTGLIVLGVYHPFFLVYDVVFILFIPFLIFILGRGAVTTAVKTSKMKYMAAAWLEDVARNQLGFKLTRTSPFIFTRVDDISTGYVEARQKYFVIMARQIFGSYIFRGFATVGVLALGGILVIEQAISLGQLVAAEIIIILVFGAMDKLITQFDSYYDMVAALNKISGLVDQELEDVGGLHVPHYTDGAEVAAYNMSFTYDDQQILSDVNFRISRGERVSLIGASGSGKSTLAAIILGLEAPKHGTVEVNGIDTRTADLRTLRKRVGYIFSENQIIPGTVLENITLGREVSYDDLTWALEMACLPDVVRGLPNGLHTMLSATGDNIALGVRRMILFARMILDRPDLLVIDEGFEGIDDGTKLRMFGNIVAWKHWTVMNITHDPELLQRTSRALILQQGRIVDQGAVSDMLRGSSTLAKLFPELCTTASQGGSNG